MVEISPDFGVPVSAVITDMSFFPEVWTMGLLFSPKAASADRGISNVLTVVLDFSMHVIPLPPPCS